MAKVNPYLNFNGNCEEAFKFYASAFGKEVKTMKFKEVPPEARMGVGDDELEKVMHCNIDLGNGFVIMGSDSPKAFGEMKKGENFFVSVSVDSEQEAKNIFDKLTPGGKVTMPLGKTFWGAYFGMFADKYGVQWMVSYEYPKQ